MYRIEYRLEPRGSWYRAGDGLTSDEAIADYHHHHEKYNSGIRRALKVEHTLVSFKTVTTIELKNGVN